MSEPGLDLHEWETRWAELEELLAEDPAGTLPDACDLIATALDVDSAGDEIAAAYAAAREVADAIERGRGVDPGDLGGAVENLRRVRESVGPAGGL